MGIVYEDFPRRKKLKNKKNLDGSFSFTKEGMVAIIKA